MESRVTVSMHATWYLYSEEVPVSKTVPLWIFKSITKSVEHLSKRKVVIIKPDDSKLSQEIEHLKIFWSWFILWDVYQRINQEETV